MYLKRFCISDRYLRIIVWFCHHCVQIMSDVHEALKVNVNQQVNNWNMLNQKKNTRYMNITTNTLHQAKI